MIIDQLIASNIAYPLGLGLAAFGGAIGIGLVVSSALSSMARQPDIMGKLFVYMLIGAALIESCVLYTFATYFFMSK